MRNARQVGVPVRAVGRQHPPDGGRFLPGAAPLAGVPAAAVD